MTADKATSGPQSRKVLDEVALARLVALAGPKDGAELIRRLLADLGDAADGIAASQTTQDRVAMRQHSHVLLAIAGTIGAQCIYDLAQRLNHTAKDEARVLAPFDLVDLVVQLRGLITRLHAFTAKTGVEI